MTNVTLYYNSASTNSGGSTTYDEGSTSVTLPDDTEARGPYRSGGRFPFRKFTDWEHSSRVITVLPGRKVLDSTGADGVSHLHISDDICVSSVPGYAPSSLPVVDPDSEQSGDLLQQAYAEMRGQAVEVLSNVGELPETIAMFNSFRSRFGRNLSKTLTEFARRPGLSFSQLWLEYEYGWRPLIMQAKDVARAVALIKLGDPVVIVGKAAHTSSQTYSDSWTPHWRYAYAPQGFLGITTKHQRDIQYRAAFASFVEAQQAAYRINIVEAAWELLPYSFVIDMFIKVGDFLSALTNAYSTQSSACLSVKFVETLEASFVGGVSGNWSVTQPGLYLDNMTSYKRLAVSTDLAVRPPRVTLPSVRQFADLLALFRVHQRA